MTQIIKLGIGIKNQSGFLDQDTLNYLAHETRLLSEIQEIESDFTETGKGFVFKLFMTHGIDAEFGFDTLNEAIETRRDFIIAMMEYWGPDQLIFVNGIDYEVTMVAAVTGITDIFCKASRFGFSLSIDAVPYPVNLIFFDHDQAMKDRESIGDKLENYLQGHSMKRNQMAMVVNG
jgi:hypothetical protein